MCKCTNLMEFLQTEIDIIQTNIDMHNADKHRTSRGEYIRLLLCFAIIIVTRNVRLKIIIMIHHMINI